MLRCIRTRSKSHRKGHHRRCVKKVSITRGLATAVMSSGVSLGTLLGFRSVSKITMDLSETRVG